jgi:hypothetical protein
MPDGTKHFLDVYVNKKPDGTVWFKLKVGKAKMAAAAVPEYGAAVAQQPSPKPAVLDLDDDIPFRWQGLSQP